MSLTDNFRNRDGDIVLQEFSANSHAEMNSEKAHLIEGTNRRFM